MDIVIRQENPEDHSRVFQIIKNAFANEQHSDHTEQLLVERLRKSASFVPELSLVAEVEGNLVGHILFTKIQIKSSEQTIEVLALAPVSVTPESQNRGIGKMLIEKGHARARQLGFVAVALLGHENYYPKFGYKPAVDYSIEFPFDASDQNCMVKELRTNALENIKGMVVYANAFYE